MTHLCVSSEDNTSFGCSRRRALNSATRSKNEFKMLDAAMACRWNGQIGVVVSEGLSRKMMMATTDLIDVRVVCDLHPHQPPQSHRSTGERLHLQRPARETAGYSGGEQVTRLPAGRLGCVWGHHPTQ